MPQPVKSPLIFGGQFLRKKSNKKTRIRTTCTLPPSCPDSLHFSSPNRILKLDSHPPVPGTSQIGRWGTRHAPRPQGATTAACWGAPSCGRKRWCRASHAPNGVGNLVSFQAFSALPGKVSLEGELGEIYSCTIVQVRCHSTQQVSLYINVTLILGQWQPRFDAHSACASRLQTPRTVLYRTALNHTVLHCTDLLYRTVLHCTVLYCTELN